MLVDMGFRPTGYVAILMAGFKEVSFVGQSIHAKTSTFFKQYCIILGRMFSYHHRKQVKTMDRAED